MPLPSHANPVSYHSNVFANVPLHTAAPDVLMHDLSHCNLPDSMASMKYSRYLQPPATRRAFTEGVSLIHPRPRNTQPITIPPARATRLTAVPAMRSRPILPQHSQPSGLHPKSGGVSWHRRGYTNDSSATTSGAVTPNADLGNISTPLSSTRLRRRAYKASKLRATSLVHDSFPGYANGRRLLSPEEKKKPPLRRRRSSLLTAAFGRKRSSTVINWVPDELLQPPTNYIIHPIIALPPFPVHWSSDTITLYTNSIRAELNDLIFLSACLQRPTPDTPPRRRGYPDIRNDFYPWFQWFSLFLKNTLRAMEQYLFPLISQMLHQRDVMISRCTAVVEAQGESHINRWQIINASLHRQIQQVCDYIHTVESRLKRLQRDTVHVEIHRSVDLTNSNLVTIRHFITTTVHLLDNLDAHISATLALRFTNKKALQSVYIRFATEIIRDPDAPLGWSAVLALTRWIEDRKARQEHVAALARAARLRFLARYRANGVHLNIVKAHRALHDEEF